MQDTYNVGIYARLSRDDERTGESVSIENQKELLTQYVKEQGWNLYDYYCDDGVSGTTFERPDWKRLIADIEAGKVGTVIVKDMSRVGRDYLQTGFYTEVMFREHGVRFIAIGNSVDSSDKSSGEFVPFLNIVNEWYLRDCSRKQCAAYQARGKAGKPTTNHAIFGYQKDPADKHHWLIDEEAAAVVRRIFQLTLNGYGPQQIANVLRDSKVDRPSVYMAKRDSGTCKNTTDMSRPYDWAATTISRILSKPEYMGHTVNFRTYKESYKDKHTISRPPEEWTVFENTHEAIVDPETWQLAQQARRTVHRTDSTGEANPLTGLVYCADCGEKMYNHRRHNQAIKQGLDKDPVSGLYPFDSYDCSTYAQTRQRTEKKCYSHYIGTKALRALIVDTIRTASRYAITNKAEFAERVRQESEIRQAEAAKDMKRKVSRARKRCTELDALIQKLYESFAKGQITDKRFETLCATYEKEQSELEAVITEEQAALDTFNADTDRVEQFMALAKKYTDFSVLTTPMIYEFIDKIFVHAPYKDENGERCQDVDIYLKFIGKFEVPMPEPTQEEIAAQQKVARYRAKKREAAKKHREKKKAEQQKTA